MYELKIKDKNGIWQTADLGDEKPAMNYTSNDIAELKDRQADYSQIIKLPITPNNTSIFEHVDEFDVKTNFPYQQHECRLYSNGCTLAGKGSFIILVKTTNYLECQILSGIATLFEQLKNAKMSDVYLGSYVRTKDLSGYSDLCYWLTASFDKEKSNSIYNNSRYLSFPFIRLIEAIPNMLEQFGYGLVDNYPKEDNYLSLSTINITKNSLNRFAGYAHGGGVLFTGGNWYLKFNYAVSEAGNISAQDQTVLFSILKEAQGITDIDISITQPQNEPARILIADSSGYTIKNKEIFGAGSISFTDIKVPANDYIRVVILLPNNEFRIAAVDFKNIRSQSSIVTENGTVFLSENLGFKNPLELLKTYVQINGFVVSVDEKNKLVSFKSLDSFYANKKDAIDWSSKLDTSVSETTFKLSGYAQKNIITLKENTSQNINDSAYFTVDNKNLDAEKELFKIDLESGSNTAPLITWQQTGTTDTITDTLNVINVPLMEDGQFKGVSAPHLAFVNGREYLKVGNMKIFYRAHNVPLQETIDKKYNSLINNILVNARAIEASFNLLDQDIEAFEQFTPVYLHQYGAYFYVNKIKNFISGKLTKCELIRL